MPGGLSPGADIGGAILEEVIGIGGQATVWRGTYRDMPVAVKTVNLPVGDMGRRALARFEREQDVFLVLQELQHPNLVKVHKAGLEKQVVAGKVSPLPYIIMELMKGAVLSHAGQQLTWQETVKFGLEAATGLQALHARHIAHRDIKPANILLAADDTVKLSDLGMVGLLDASSEHSWGLTLAYASPEQCHLDFIAKDDIPAKHPDELSDIYSLGVTFFQMLAGELPIDGHPVAYFQGLTASKRLPSGLPDSLCELVYRMFHRRRDQRPRSIDDVLQTLEHVRLGRTQVSIPTPAELSREEEFVNRYATAYVRPGFYDALLRLKDAEFGGWRPLSIYAIGGEGILLRVAREKRHALLKMPNLPYDRPASFGRQEIAKAREELELEAAMLKRFSDSLLPALVELAEGCNPLLADRPQALAQSEKFLVMEFLPGRLLDQELRARIKLQAAGVGRWLGNWLRDILAFMGRLRAKEPKHFYTDFKPSNILISPYDYPHLLDGGSITWAGSSKGIPATAGFCPAALHQKAYDMDGLEQVSLVTLARTLYSALCNKVLYDDTPVARPVLAPICGPAWATWICSVAEGEIKSIEIAQARLPIET